MVSARVTLVRAPNPSAMTLTGTNSYIVDCGEGRAICIDPGPAMDRHIDALLARAQALGVVIESICVTHGHPDHAPGAALLARQTGAPVAAHRNAAFPHDRTLGDGDVVCVGETSIDVLDAPGHTFDHLVFYDREDRALFTGDVVLGEGTVVIAPPNGAMRAYQRTLQRLLDEYPQAELLYGGHGPPVGNPQAKIREYIAHRQFRERELLDVLASGPQTIPQLVRRIYRDTKPVLWPAAARQMLAYLIALEEEGRVRSQALPRAMDSNEAAILNPSWESIVGREEAAVVEEELGAMLRLETLYEYAAVTE